MGFDEWVKDMNVNLLRDKTPPDRIRVREDHSAFFKCFAIVSGKFRKLSTKPALDFLAGF